MTRTGRFALALPIAFVLAGCGAVPASVSAAAGGTSTVVYEVTGPAKANNITYSADGKAGIAQENGGPLPWRKEVQMSGSFKVATLTAQNAGKGDITCRITVDGKVVKELTSSGEYAVATCATEAF